MRKSNYSIDPFYTPPWLAEQLAGMLPGNLCGNVLDPCVGGGSLLEAVESRFGSDVALLGADLNPNAVRELRASKPDWIVGLADMLHPRSRNSSRPWQQAKAELSAVLLNPPFSHRGNGGDIVSYGEFVGRVAPANRFLIEALKELDPVHGFYAILPDGAIEAERHRQLWDEIRKRNAVKVLARVKPTSFRGARVSTSLLSITPGKSEILQPSLLAGDHSRQSTCTCVEVIRGRVPVHSLRNLECLGGTPFLHTTNLSASFPSRFAPNELADEAPFILIPRVGRWKQPKLIQLGRVVLSDCLIALRPSNAGQLNMLQETLVDNAETFQREFKGTGAPYLTLNALTKVLDSLGWSPRIVKAGSPFSECACGSNKVFREEGEHLAIAANENLAGNDVRL